MNTSLLLKRERLTEFMRELTGKKNVQVVVETHFNLDYCNASVHFVEAKVPNEGALFEDLAGEVRFYQDTIVIAVTVMLFELLTDEELKAVLAHEAGHVLHGGNELVADRFAISKGYGPLLGEALAKMYAHHFGPPPSRFFGALTAKKEHSRRDDWDAYQYNYFATPRDRVNALKEGTR